MSLRRRIRRAVFDLLHRVLDPPPKTLRDHYRRTVRAWESGERELERMAFEWKVAGAVCCPGCMFGHLWIDLVRKQERREETIRWMERKLERDSRVSLER